jgi:hypothetical protein
MSPIIPSNWKVPEVFHSRLGETAGRQRMMFADGHLLLVLHKVPEPGNPDRVSLLFWRDPAGVFKSTGSGAALAELRSYMDEFAVLADKLDKRMDQPPNADNYFQILNTTTPLLRTVRNMHKTLQDAREAVPADRNILIARDQAGELERALELLHTDAQHGLNYMVARQAEEQSRTSHELVHSGHKLNLLIALFLPLTALGSAFGMNLKHGLEGISSPLLFWTVLIGGFALGFIVKAGISKSQS